MYLRGKSGFTLVETVLALAIFSAALLVMTVGLLQLIHIYEAGHQIRDTQEAARTLGEAITNDTRDSLVVATSIYNGTGSICAYKTIQQLAGGGNTLNGIEYYIGPYSSSNSMLTVHRADITTLYTPPTPPGCPPPNPSPPPNTDNVLTSSAVTIKFLVASDAPASDPRLLSVKMSVESDYAQQAGVDFQYNPTSKFDQCLPDSNAQYCSITNIQFSALGHSESGI